MKRYCFILFLIALNGNTLAQQSKIDAANKKYNDFAYIDALKIYEKVAEKGFKSSELYKKTGDAYYFNGEFEKAEKWYAKLFEKSKFAAPDYYFRYSQTLKSVGNYQKANEYLALYSKRVRGTRSNMFKTRPDYLEDIERKSGRYLVDTVSNINSAFSDFGSGFWGNQIVFSSSRTEGAVHNKKNLWTGHANRDLYIAEEKEQGKFVNPVNFSPEINTKYNETSAVFTKDGKTMYFTRNNYNNGKKGKSRKKSVLLKIYRASYIDGKWANVIELPFNSDNYSTAHPALSSDEKTLYFASDMPKGFGNSDIYKVSIDGNNYGKPENLGKNINTEGKETFPFIGADNTLYFASDGHLGLGGLDIFSSNFNGKTYSRPENLGKPINSGKDDFGFVINDNYEGYFSSNRNGGKGLDDIYTFAVCFQKFYGTITDEQTAVPIPNAKIELYDDLGKKVFDTQADENGFYAFEISCNLQYFIRIKKETYIAIEQPLTTVENNIGLRQNTIPITVGTDLGKVFEISQIFFDRNKFDIRPDAARDLQKIVEVMLEYPKMHIAIRSHTDSRQTHEYNRILSENRAKSTLEYIVSNGIERHRLTAKGLGETELINRCADGVDCTEEEHQQNRRSEFIVIQME